MANNSVAKSGDFIATMIGNPDQSVETMIDSGINSANTTLQDKSSYRDTSKIQEMFTGKDGKFDDKGYDKFYEQARHAYNQMAEKTFNDENVIARSYFDNQLHVPKEKKVRSASGWFEQTYNPIKDSIGFQGLNEHMSNGKSVRELAQENLVYDYKTGESLGWRPNDDAKSGVLDFIFNTEPVVLAQFDEEGEHKDPFSGKIVKHKKGDYKLDSNGDFFYENLGNREATDKTFLSMSDTLSNEGSFANKFDFMDSDGIDKSITGTVVKTAASIAPYFIPYVNVAYTVANTALDLGDAMPSLIKSMAGVWGEDLSNSEFLNKLQGKARSIKGEGKSDYAKEHMFGAEGIMSMVSDTFEQLYSQKAIAKIPSLLGSQTSNIAKYQKEINTLLGSENAAKFATLGADAQNSVIQQLATKSKAMQDLIKKQEYWSTTGAKALSSLYMAATSSTQAYEDAKRQGLDQQDASMYYMGVFAGMYGLTSHTKIGHWALRGLGVDDVAKGIQGTIKKEGVTLGENMAKANASLVSSGATEAVKKGNRMLSLFNSGKDLAVKAVKKIATEPVETLLHASVAEGIEEVSEEMLQDGLKGVYNMTNLLGISNTDSDKNKRFQFSADDVMARYATSFVGGAIGGAVFHLNDKLLSDTSNSTPEKENKDLLWYVSNGYGQQVKTKIKALADKGAFGSTSLTPNAIYAEHFNFDKPDFEATTDKTKSQNQYIADLLIAKVDQLSSLVDQYDIPSEIALGEEYNKKIDNIRDIKLDSALNQDIEEYSDVIFNNVAKLRELTNSIGDNPDVEKSSTNEKIKEIQNNIKDAREEMKAISNGERLQKYFEEAFFSTNPLLSSKFGVKSANDFAEAKFNKQYFELTETQREYIDELCNNYEGATKRNQLKISKMQFDNYKELLIKNRNSIKKRVDLANESPFTLNLDYLNDLTNYIDIKQHTQPMEIDGETVQRDVTDVINDYNSDRLDAISSEAKDIAMRYNTDKPKLQIALDKKIKEFKIDDLIKKYPALSNTFNDAIKELIELEFTGNLDNKASNKFEHPEDIQLKTLLGNQSIPEFTLNSTPEEFALLENKLATSQENLDYFNNTIRPIYENRAEIIEAIKKLDKKFKEAESKPSHLLGLLDEITINIEDKGEAKDVTTIFKLLDDDKKRLLEGDIFDYVINNKVTEAQLEKALECINKTALTMQHLTNLSGYGNETFITATNNIMAKNDQKSGYEDKAFEQEELLQTLQELKYYSNRITYMLEISKSNKSNKVKYDKNSAIMYKLRNALSLINNPEISYDGANITEYLGEDFFADNEEYDKVSNEIFQFCRDKFGDQLYSFSFSGNFSNAEIEELEEKIYRLEDIVYNKIQGSDEGVSVKSSIIAALKEKNIGAKIVNDAINHPSKFNAQAENYSISNSLYHLFELATIHPKTMNSYILGPTVDGKNEFEKSPYAPLQSQETAVKMTIANIASRDQKYDIYAHFFNSLKVDLNSPNKELKTEDLAYSIQNSMQLLGYSGTGKSTITNIISRILENMGKKVSIYAPLETQAKNLSKIVGDRDNVIKDNNNTVSELISSLIGVDLYNELHGCVKNKLFSKFDLTKDESPNENSQIVNFVGNSDSKLFRINEHNNKIKEALKTLGDNKLESDVIFIDEYTHISPIDLNILELFTEQYNSKHTDKPLSIIFAGDPLQMGHLVDVSNTNEIDIKHVNEVLGLCTPRLTDMIRAGYNTKIDNINNTLSMLEVVIKMNAASGSSKTKIKDYVKSNEIRLSYYEDDAELIGEKLVDSISVEELKHLANKYDSSIGVIVNSLEDQIVKDINSLPAEVKAKFIVKAGAEVQGSEFEHTIIAAKIDPLNFNDSYDVENKLKELYTFISRSKKSSLIYKNAIPEGLKIDNSKTNDNSKAEFDPSNVEKYKEFRLKLLQQYSDEAEIKKLVPSTDKVLEEQKYEASEWDEDKVISVFEHLKDALNPNANDDDAIKEAYSKKVEDSEIYMYPFHERSTIVNGDDGYSYGINDYLIDEEALLGGIRSADTLTEKDVEDAKSDCRIIKNAVLTKALYQKGKSIKDLLGGLASKYPHINFDKYKLVIESIKYNDTTKDSSGVTKPAKESDKPIHFLNIMFDAKYDGDDDAYQVYFTIAALPNINNTNVSQIKQVSDYINNLNKVYESQDEYSIIREIKSDNPLDLISKIGRSNKFAKLKDPITFEEYKEKNKHITFSNPQVSTRDLSVLLKDDKDFKNFLKEGQTIVFFTYDQSLSPNELSHEYIKQLIAFQKKEISDMSVRVMYVSPEKIPFTEWIEKVKETTNKIQSGSYNPESRIYENHYVAARLLFNMMINTQYNKYLLDNEKPSAKQKESVDKLVSELGSKEDAKAINNFFVDRLRTLVGKTVFDNISRDILSKDSNDEKDAAREAKFKEILDIINKQFNTQDLTVNSLQKFLNECSKENEAGIDTLLSKINANPDVRYATILSKLIYSNADNYLIKGSDITRDYPNFVTNLIKGNFNGEFKNGTIPVHFTIGKKGNANLTPFFCPAINPLSQFMVTAQSVPQNISFNLSGLSDVTLEEDMEASKARIEENKARLHKDWIYYSINYSDNLNFDQDYESVLSDLSKNLKDIIVFENRYYEFNCRVENGNLVFDNIDLMGNKTTNKDVDKILKSNPIPPVVSVDGKNLIITTTDGIEYTFDTKQDKIVSSINKNPKTTEKSTIINKFVENYPQYKNLEAEFNKIVENDKDLVISEINKLLYNNGHHVILSGDANDLILTSTEIKVEAVQQIIEPVEVKELEKTPIIPITANVLTEQEKANPVESLKVKIQNEVIANPELKATIINSGDTEIQVKGSAKYKEEYKEALTEVRNELQQEKKQEPVIKSEIIPASPIKIEKNVLDGKENILNHLQNTATFDILNNNKILTEEDIKVISNDLANVLNNLEIIDKANLIRELTEVFEQLKC